MDKRILLALLATGIILLAGCAIGPLTYSGGGGSNTYFFKGLIGKPIGSVYSDAPFDTNKQAEKVDSSKFAKLADGEIVWVQGQTKFDDSLNQVVFSYPRAAVEFISATGNLTPGVQIPLLGENWVVATLGCPGTPCVNLDHSSGIRLRLVDGENVKVIATDGTTYEEPDWTVGITLNPPSGGGKITLKNEAANNALIKLQAGGSFPIMQHLQSLKLVYYGLDIPADGYDTLSFKIVDIASSSPMKVSDTASCSSTRNVYGSLVYVSGPANYFTIGTGGPGSKFYWNPVLDELYFQPAGVTQCYYKVGNGLQVAYNPGDGEMQLALMKDNPTTSRIFFWEAVAPSSNDAFVPWLDKTNPNNIVFTPSNTVRYLWRSGGGTNEEPGFVSERGSQFVSIHSTTASFKVSKTVGQGTYGVQKVPLSIVP